MGAPSPIGGTVAIPVRSPQGPTVVNRSFPLATGLLNAWDLGEGNARSLFNTVGGSPVGTAVLAPSSNFGQVPRMANNGAYYIDVPYPAFSVASATALTVSIWARYNGTNTDWGTPICQGNWNSGNFSLIVRASSGLGSSADAWASFNGSVLSLTQPVADLAWHHWAFVGTGAGAALYLDGKLLGSNTTAVTSFSGTDDLKFGIQSGSGFPWGGDLALPKIWTRALSNSEIISDMAKPFALLRPAVQRSYYGPRLGGGLTGSLADAATSTSTFLASLFATASVADASVSADSLTGLGTATAALADAVTTQDLQSGTGSSTGSLADGTSGASTFVGSTLGTLADAARSGDGLTGANAATASLTDAATSQDALTGAGVATATLTDASTVAATYTAASVLVAALADASVVAATYTGTGTTTGSLADAAATAESYLGALTATASLIDVSTSTDGLLTGFFAALTDASVTHDALTATVVLTASLSDVSTVGATYAGSVVVVVALADSGQVADALVGTAASVVALADATSVSDALSVPLTGLTDAAVMSELWSSVFGATASLVDAVTTHDLYVAGGKPVPVPPSRIVVTVVHRRIIVTGRDVLGIIMPMQGLAPYPEAYAYPEGSPGDSLLYQLNAIEETTALDGTVDPLASVRLDVQPFDGVISLSELTVTVPNTIVFRRTSGVPGQVYVLRFTLVTVGNETSQVFVLLPVVSPRYPRPVPPSANPGYGPVPPLSWP